MLAFELLRRPEMGLAVVVVVSTEGLEVVDFWKNTALKVSLLKELWKLGFFDVLGLAVVDVVDVVVLVVEVDET